MLSTNSGASWTTVNSGLPTSNSFYALAVSPNGAGGTNLYAGRYGDVFLSTNNGASWTGNGDGLTSGIISALATYGTNLFAGHDRAGVFLLTNFQARWTEVREGLTYTQVWSLAVYGTYLFVGTERGGVWRRPLSEMITSVEKISTDAPTHFSLGQNYPNPFNPSTVIQYDLPVAGHVTLVVYDMLGHVVAKLVDELQSAGTFNARWDGSGAANGVYFYRLQARDFVQTKKMIVVK